MEPGNRNISRDELEAENARLRGLLRQAGIDAATAATRLDESHSEARQARDERDEMGRSRRNLQAIAEQLAASDAYNRAILESSTDYAIISLDPDGRVTTWNEGAHLIFGWSKEEMVGETLKLLFTPEQVEAGIPEQEMTEALAKGRAADERWHMRRDGTRFWANGTMMPLRTETDRHLGFLKILRDRTEQRAAQQALRESEERFRIMADSAPALIWVSDADARVVFANNYYDDMFGRPAKEFLGEGWRDIIHPDDLENLVATFTRATEDLRPFRAEVRMRDRNGEVRWLRCEGAPRVKDGEFQGYVGCNVDITEAKLAADALERAIEERTRELAAANRQLVAQIEQREKAESALRQMQRLEAVGQLTSGVAHDFNNLLTVILGSIGFLERQLEDPKQQRRIAMMKSAAERGATLTERLLAFSRRQRLAPRSVDLNNAVEAMRDLLQSTLGGSFQIDFRFSRDLWPALVDPVQLELVILNLAINARDAMEVGGCLTIETANVTVETPASDAEPEAGDYVMLSVADTGSGMTDEVLAHAFEPFFTTKQTGSGSGLGLAQAYGFAKQSGGGIRIDTQVGQGTVVRVYLPRDTAGATEEAPAPDDSPVRQDSSAGGTILLVDDDNAVRDVTAAMLRDIGYTVVEAGSGAAALEMLDRQPDVDLLLADYAMPGMNGAELLHAVAGSHPGLPALLITGYANEAALKDVGKDRFIWKPFTVSDLRSRIGGAIRNRRPPT